MNDTDCTCIPCTTPAHGAPGIDHCPDCCRGSLIEEYDFNCPIFEHRDWAARQFPGVVGTGLADFNE